MTSGAETAALIAAGGVGAITRFVVDGLVTARVRRPFPYGTLTINVTGSLLLGILTGLVLFQGSPTGLRMIAGTGFCGGYTTFSAATVEAVRLALARRPWAALGSSAGTLVLTVSAAAIGLALTRL